MSAATKLARTRVERRLKWLREMVLYLQEYVNFPPLHFPEFNCRSQPTLIADEMIEEIASEAREFWKLRNAHIPDLVRLLEQHSTIIARDGLDAETLDALSLWGSLENLPYIIPNADKQSTIRSRTDAAHELGHLLLHRNIKRSQLPKEEENYGGPHCQGQNPVRIRKPLPPSHRAGRGLRPARDCSASLLAYGNPALDGSAGDYRTSSTPPTLLPSQRPN